jgi:outer membrane protein
MRSSDSSRRRASVVASGYILESVVWVALICAPIAAHPQQSAETMPANKSNRPASQSDQIMVSPPDENAQAISTPAGQSAPLKIGGASAALWALRPAGLRAANQTTNQTSNQAAWSRIFSAARPNIQAAASPFQGRSCPPQPLVAQTSGRVTLSFQQSVRLALENNYDVLIAREQINEAKGQAEQARAALLPNLSGAVSQEVETLNLAAQGLRRGLFPPKFNIPMLAGPFGVFDARAQMTQRVFSLQAIRLYQAGKTGVQVARFEEDLKRQQIAQQTALAYVNAVSADRAIEAACANVDLAQSLLTQARDQRDAGVATGVDVTRAETRLAQEQAQLAQALTIAEQARLELLRITALPLAREVVLTDMLRLAPVALPAVDLVVAEAERERPEIWVAEEELKRRRYILKAARAELLPSLDFFGDYGESGNTPVQNSVPTYEAGIRLNIPIFNGGLTLGRIKEAKSLVRQAELILSDTRQQVEQDVRLALQTIVTAAEQARAAREAVRLAERELTMSRDRFAAGVTDNLEVVTAQTTLADARFDEIDALAQYNTARINLAAARGRIESFRW